MKRRSDHEKMDSFLFGGCDGAVAHGLQRQWGAGDKSSQAHRSCYPADHPAHRSHDGATVPTTQPTEPATQPTEPAEKSKFGKVEGNTYTNSYLGVTCTLDENWHIATAEERAALNGLTAEMISDEELAEVFRSSGAAMDLYAENANGLSLNIMLEDLNLLYSLILSEENYANQTIDQLAPALESMGFTDVHSEKATITFAGAEHAGIRISAKISGFDFYETLVLVKVDGCMATVTAGALGENVTEDILARFTPVEG